LPAAWIPRQATLAKIDELMAIALAKVGTVTIEAPEGADVLLDGRAVGRAPLREPIFVDPGDHAFEVRLAEHAPKKQQVRTVEVQLF
jgi:PEGA domain-containing protein